MKAILQYGQFTAMIELPTPQRTVSIMKPMQELSFIPLAEEDLTELKTQRLDFFLSKHLTDDIWLYEFDREV